VCHISDERLKRNFYHMEDSYFELHEIEKEFPDNRKFYSRVGAKIELRKKQPVAKYTLSRLIRLDKLPPELVLVRMIAIMYSCLPIIHYIRLGL